jgi:hypothetical protein
MTNLRNRAAPEILANNEDVLETVPAIGGFATLLPAKLREFVAEESGVISRLLPRGFRLVHGG